MEADLEADAEDDSDGDSVVQAAEAELAACDRVLRSGKRPIMSSESSPSPTKTQAKKKGKKGKNNSGNLDAKDTM